MSKPRNVAIVTPLHKEVYKQLELQSLRQCLEVFYDYDKFLVLPYGLSTLRIDHLLEPFERIYFPKLHFDSLSAYNRLLLSPKFYSMFSNYDYILIYQTDAFVFEDKLEYFIDLNYDYYGAPWLGGVKVPRWQFHGISLLSWFLPVLKTHYLCYVGNGGFSLRRISSTISVLEATCRFTAKTWLNNEDYFFALAGVLEHVNFQVPPVALAAQFAWETEPAECYKMTGGKPPFGCHGFHRHDTDFYESFFKALGYNIAMPSATEKLR